MSQPVVAVPPAVDDAADLDLAWRLWRLGDDTPAFALRAACRLGIADHVGGEARPVGDLATATGTDTGALGRLLRVLAVHGVVEAVPPDRYRLTAVGELLTHDHPLSMVEAYQPPGLELAAWAALDHSIRTGEAAFEHVYGVSHRRYRAEHPDEDARMDRAHRAGTRVEVLTIVRMYDWSTVHTVIDVGGGTGAFLAGLLRRFRHLNGVLFDLPQMLSNADEVLADAGISDRCSVVPGDFFVEVPGGADVYVLKAVIGGWDDASATSILRTVRHAMRPESRLLIIEPVLQYGPDFLVGSIVHLQSLVLYGGPDRTREEYERLFAAAGLRLLRIIARPTLPILELTAGEAPR